MIVSPSPQQQALIDFPLTGRGSVFGEAVAGAGKTTTALLAVANMSGSVAVMAFNKAAAVEFKTKAIKLGLQFDNRVRFGTCHSFGLAGWRRVYPQVKCGPEAATKKRDMTIAKFRSIKSPEKLDAFTLKLVGLAKQTALDLFGDIDDRKAWHDIVEHHDLSYDLEADEGEFENTGEVSVDKGIDLAIRALRYHRAIAPQVIDFDDMIYMPVTTGIKLWENDWVVGDEWQDANRARRALARKMLRPTGRAMFIGDRHQAIYGFTGADNASIDNTIREFNCSELPLTVTYRCPKAVVAEAQKTVDHIQAHDSAPEGVVSSALYNDFVTTAVCTECKGEAAGPCETCMNSGYDRSAYHFTDLAPSDAILCRKTKPLVSLAFFLIRKGIACHVEGRDIGAGLIKLLNRMVGRNDAMPLHVIRDRLEAYAEKEVAKLTAKGKETQAEALRDRVDTLIAITESQPPASSASELRDRINNMFLDGTDQVKRTVTLATVHKSKGREWPRVFILGRADFMPSPWARQAWQLEQEANIIYVAVTRAQEELVMLNGLPD